MLGSYDQCEIGSGPVVQKCHFHLISQSKMIITFLIYIEIQWALRCEWQHYVSAIWNNSSVGQIQSVFKMWAKSFSFRVVFPSVSPSLSLFLVSFISMSLSEPKQQCWVSIWLIKHLQGCPVENKHADVPSPTSLSLPPLFFLSLPLSSSPFRV